ncbi:F-box domain-containing protein [Mycena kentingensis (nom. inval.)]|nr:F-box domain-containing protein [Mycena kentingensis (nom. inval.)]
MAKRTQLQRRPEYTSGLDHLPIEMLARIFEYRLHDTPDDTAHLSLVSHRWNDIVATTPALWTNIVVHMDPTDPSWVPKAVAKLNLHAKRSGALMVWIELSCDIHPMGSGCEPIYGSLCQFNGRIRSLILTLPPSYIAAHTDEAVPEGATILDVSNLRHLSVDALFDPDSVSEYQVSMFAVAPSLRSIALAHASLDQFAFPWVQLEQLEASGYDLHDCIHMLAQAPRLVRASFALTTTMDRAEVPSAVSGRIVHPRLEEVKILESRGFEPHALEYFSFPALRTLTVGTSDYDDQEMDVDEAEREDVLQPDVFSSFLRLSGDNLERLVILDAGRSDRATDVFFGLRVAELEVRRASYGFVRSFFGGMAHDAFLPRLKRIELHCLEQMETNAEEEDECDDDDDDDEGDDALDCDESTVLLAMRTGFAAIVKRNSEAGTRPGAPAAIRELTILSDGSKYELYYKYSAETLEQLQLPRLLQLGVSVSVGSEDRRFYVV